jgi:U3 small nucleolar ribonucleoprotein component
LDELFDDPIRKVLPKGKGDKDEDNQMDFIKSKKGLGDVYEDEYRKTLLDKDPNSYLTKEFSGVDAGLKKEIDEIMKGLFYSLDCLSNFNYTPRPPSKETTIST